MTDISELSEREREILHLVATGASNKEIAKELYISTNTVKVHLRNIFAKIEVSSRTEAAMYAVSAGLVEPITSIDEGGFTVISGEGDSNGYLPTKKNSLNGLLQYFVQNPWLIIVLFLILLALGVISLSLINRNQSTTLASNGSPNGAPPPRWQENADLPTARSGLAIAAYEDQIYAIGGETSDGVTNVVERYDPATDRWVTLLVKPTSVADVSAAVIGGLIFVPGGRLPSGNPTDKLEVYDPREGKWELRASLPKPISAYALVAFEGKLFLFGGWDGNDFISDVFEYNPDTDIWLERTSMLTQRGFAGAAIAGGKIYVLGGFDGKEALSVNEEYLPENDIGTSNPWKTRAPLPSARYAMGVVGVADFIHVIGGQGDVRDDFQALVYLPESDDWRMLGESQDNLGAGLGAVALGSNIYAIGGKRMDITLNQNIVYQAMYTTSIPIIIR